jgi:hypothetical protein
MDVHHRFERGGDRGVVLVGGRDARPVPRKLGDIGSRAQVTAGASQDDHPRLVGAIERSKRAPYALPHRQVEGVPTLRAREDHLGDALVVAHRDAVLNLARRGVAPKGFVRDRAHRVRASRRRAA